MVFKVELKFCTLPLSLLKCNIKIIIIHLWTINVIKICFFKMVIIILELELDLFDISNGMDQNRHHIPTFKCCNLKNLAPIWLPLRFSCFDDHTIWGLWLNDSIIIIVVLWIYRSISLWSFHFLYYTFYLKLLWH